MTMEMRHLCPVCQSGQLFLFRELAAQVYLRCPVCEATVMAPECRPGPESERQIYELHENNPEDPGYRRFLSRLAEPLMQRLQAGSEGLDFGCGPGPALARMLEEAGFVMHLYDPFFCPDEGALARTYDFITCTEVVEHLHQPARVLAQLDRLLRPGGWLGIMTCFQTDDARFDNWHYRRDPTHVVFYRETTFAVIARRLGWRLHIPVRNVVLLHKPRQARARMLL